MRAGNRQGYICYHFPKVVCYRVIYTREKQFGYSLGQRLYVRNQAKEVDTNDGLGGIAVDVIISKGQFIYNLFALGSEKVEVPRTKIVGGKSCSTGKCRRSSNRQRTCHRRPECRETRRLSSLWRTVGSSEETTVAMPSKKKMAVILTATYYFL